LIGLTYWLLPKNY